MQWRQYVLETRWAFDHDHTEFCTFSFEGDGDFADLFKPEGAPPT